MATRMMSSWIASPAKVNFTEFVPYIICRRVRVHCNPYWVHQTQDVSALDFSNLNTSVDHKTSKYVSDCLPSVGCKVVEQNNAS